MKNQSEHSNNFAVLGRLLTVIFLMSIIVIEEKNKTVSLEQDSRDPVKPEGLGRLAVNGLIGVANPVTIPRNFLFFSITR